MVHRRAILAPLGLLIAAASLTASVLLMTASARADGADEVAAPHVPTRPATGPAVVVQEGLASWYGPRFHGRLTACGETYDQESFTAAHRSLPFGTLLAVTNLDTGCSVMLRVNDRGPYHGNRILDCSRAGAEELGFVDDGVARIRWEIIDPEVVAGAPISRSLAPRSAAAPGAASSSSRLSPLTHGSSAEPPRPINSEEASW